MAFPRPADPLRPDGSGIPQRRLENAHAAHSYSKTTCSTRETPASRSRSCLNHNLNRNPALNPFSFQICYDSVSLYDSVYLLTASTKAFAIIRVYQCSSVVEFLWFHLIALSSFEANSSCPSPRSSATSASLR